VGQESKMTFPRFLGVGIFFIIGLLLGAFGVFMASHYQKQASADMRRSKIQFKEAKTRFVPRLREIAEQKRKVSILEQKLLNQHDQTLRKRWRETVEDRIRVENRYYGKLLPNRNYAMMIAILGFAFMVWGLFRVLQD
jgi:ABC-type transport system involved in cytochrome bd biosynthesis fused ATPase/permease subunit